MIDNANRLTQITQGSAIVTIGYDYANRRTSLTLPNGIVAAYGYDAASRLTSLTYTHGATTIGNLAYTYDANGRRITMGGSLAKVNLPAAVPSAMYNANNQLTNWNGTVMGYDLNGNMTSDGTSSYSGMRGTNWRRTARRRSLMMPSGVGLGTPPGRRSCIMVSTLCKNSRDPRLRRTCSLVGWMRYSRARTQRAQEAF